MIANIFDRLMLAINLIPTASTLNNFLARLMPPIRNNFLRKKPEFFGILIQAFLPLCLTSDFIVAASCNCHEVRNHVAEDRSMRSRRSEIISEVSNMF